MLIRSRITWLYSCSVFSDCRDTCCENIWLKVDISYMLFSVSCTCWLRLCSSACSALFSSWICCCASVLSPAALPIAIAKSQYIFCSMQAPGKPPHYSTHKLSRNSFRENLRSLVCEGFKINLAPRSASGRSFQVPS